MKVDGPTAVVLDHGREFLGHTRIELVAAADTVVDVAHEEGLRADGQLHFFRSNPFATGGDRFVCRGGRQTLETFLPRGGRWTQVTVRGPAVLHAVDTRDANAVPEVVGRVDTGDDLLDRAWAVGVETLRACTEDVFCDSPWRERGLYLGDAWVQSLTGLCVSADASVPARSLRLFAASQRDDGRFPCVVPGWLGLPHADFDLLYAVWLRDVWARTGDLDLARDCLPAARRALAAPAWMRSRHSILWDATEADRLFIDWGCVEAARTMPENAVLGMLRVRAAEGVAELSAALGEDPAIAAAEATAVREALHDRLWRGDHFAGGTDRPAVLHANVLALAFGIGDPDALLTHLRPQLAGNAERAIAGPRFGGFLELYFLKFALDGLTRVGADAGGRGPPPLAPRPDARRRRLGVLGDPARRAAWRRQPVPRLERLGGRAPEPPRAWHPRGRAGGSRPPRARPADDAARGLRRFPHRLGPVRVRWSRTVRGAGRCEGRCSVRCHCRERLKARPTSRPFRLRDFEEPPVGLESKPGAGLPAARAMVRPDAPYEAPSAAVGCGWTHHDGLMLWGVSRRLSHGRPRGAAFQESPIARRFFRLVASESKGSRQHVSCSTM